MRHIDGDVIMEKLYKLYNSLSGEARQAVSRAIDIVTDAEDVDPVHRSRWIHPEGEDESDDWHECQSCGFGMIFGGDGVYLDDAKYCMGCGAKMEDADGTDRP